MKAAVYDVEGAPGVLKYVDVPEPVTGPDDILISVEAISIEGGDLINRRSTPPPLPSWIVTTRPRAQLLPSDRKSEAVRLGTESLLFTCRDRMRNVGLCPRNAPGLYPMGWEWQKRRHCRFHLEPRIIAFSREACSGREKPFLFRPQRVAWGSRPFSLPHKQAQRSSPW